MWSLWIYLAFSGLLDLDVCLFSQVRGNFQLLFLWISFFSFLSLPFGAPTIFILAQLMVSHIPCRLSSCFVVLWLDTFHCLVFEFLIFSSLHLVHYWITLLFFFLVQLLYSLALWFLFAMFSIFCWNSLCVVLVLLASTLMPVILNSLSVNHLLFFHQIFSGVIM